MTEKTKTEDFAVIKSGGKQYLVNSGDEILVDRIYPVKSRRLRGARRDEQFNRVKKNKETKKGTKISFLTLLINKAGNLKIGNPNLKNNVKAEVIEEIKDEKVIVFKYHPKKRYRKKTGFRAKKTNIKILSI
jgi:large subunit ribosomal protein L21